MTPTEFTERFDYDPDNDLLGEGGFGKIFKAWDNIRNEFIALKMSKVQPEMEEFSLLSEYERVKQLEHPNIARYMDCRRLKLPGIGTHDIALMKYYEHGNLAHLLKQHNLSPVQKDKIIEGLLDGIAYLHNQKPLIIHSDLKPSNILIVERRGFFIPLITDFGISRRATVEDKSYVTNTTGAGTYAYAAPEQWEARAIRPNADLWSFAILLIYVWFNGKKLPFRSDDISIATESGRVEYMKRVMALDFVPDLKGLPDAYQKVIGECLVISPQDRAKNTDQLYQILRSGLAAQANGQESAPSSAAKPIPIAPRRKPESIPHLSVETTQILHREPQAVPAITKEEVKPEPVPAAEPRKKKNYALPATVAVGVLAGLSWFVINSDSKPNQQQQNRRPIDTVSIIKKDSAPVAVVPKSGIEEKPRPKPVLKPKKNPGLDKSAVYNLVEESPQFPGGHSAMDAWIVNHLQMPDAAARSFISGAVRVEFVVFTDGSLHDIHIIRKLGYGCDEEALRLVRMMPRWTPGKTARQAVKVRTIVSIPFD